MLLWLVLSACDLSCDRLYVPSLLLVRFDAQEWPVGAYTLELEDQDTFATLSCEAVLPGASMRCTDDASQLVVDGDALLQAELWDFAPDQVEVRLLRDGETLLWETHQPEYEEFEPNGEGCGVQRVGAIDLVW